MVFHRRGVNKISKIIHIVVATLLFFSTATALASNLKTVENNVSEYSIEGVQGELLRKKLFSPVDLKSWDPKMSPSLMALFAPLYNSHPEALEGRPSLTIDVRKTTSGNQMVVQITMLGLLDDSVSGEEFLGFVAHQENIWVLKSLWKRNLCSRGELAGQWTRKLCP